MRADGRRRRRGRGNKRRQRFKVVVGGRDNSARGGRKASKLTTSTEATGSTITGIASGGRVRGRGRGVTGPGASPAASHTMPQLRHCCTEIVRAGEIERGPQQRKVEEKAKQGREAPSTEWAVRMMVTRDETNAGGQWAASSNSGSKAVHFRFRRTARTNRQELPRHGDRQSTTDPKQNTRDLN